MGRGRVSWKEGGKLGRGRVGGGEGKLGRGRVGEGIRERGG